MRRAFTATSAVGPQEIDLEAEMADCAFQTAMNFDTGDMAREGMEQVVPPLQSLAAMTSMAVVNQSPKTPAPAIIDLVAEIMFLVKINSSVAGASSSDNCPKALEDAIKGANSELKLKLNMTADMIFEFFIVIRDDVILFAASADNPRDAERKAFQRAVKRILNSDYCFVDGDNKVALYSTAADAPTGSFRYDLRCQFKWILSTEVPFCEGCAHKGHFRRFCFASNDELEPEHPKIEVDDLPPSPPPGFVRATFRQPPTLEASSERAFNRSNPNGAYSSHIVQSQINTNVETQNIVPPNSKPASESRDSQFGSKALNTSIYDSIVGSSSSAPTSNLPFQSASQSSMNIPVHVTQPKTSRRPSPAKASHLPTPPSRPQTFEERYRADSPFFGCFHPGGEVKSSYDDFTLNLKLLQLPARLKNFKGIKQHVKGIVKAAHKPKEFVMSDSTIMAFLRCTFLQGLSVYVLRTEDCKEGHFLDEDEGNNFRDKQLKAHNYSLYIEDICVGMTWCLKAKVVPVLTRDFLVRVMTMAMSVVNKKIKWSFESKAASSSASLSLKPVAPAAASSSKTTTSSLLRAERLSGATGRKHALTIDMDLNDPKYSEETWFDRLHISGSQEEWGRGLPPIQKIDVELLLPKIVNFIDLLVIEKKTPGRTKQSTLLLRVASEVGVEVTFGIHNGPGKVEARLWFESAVVECASFDSTNVQVQSVVHILINKFFQGISSVMDNWSGKACRMTDHGTFFKFSFLAQAGNRRW